jgi:uncharacterized protein YebE (UPF0316 family)
VTPIFDIDPKLIPFVIFFARIGDVSLGTIRTICVTRGQRLAAVTLGFFEILIWIVAVSSVFAHLDHWINAVAYAAGFAAGNGIGMWLEAKLALGVQILSFISRGKAHAVAERLRYAELRVTTLSGSGRDGPVALCVAVVPRKQTRAVIKMARDIDPDVMVTVEDVRETSAAYPRTVGAGKTPLALGGQLWPWGIRQRADADQSAADRS